MTVGAGLDEKTSNPLEDITFMMLQRNPSSNNDSETIPHFSTKHAQYIVVPTQALQNKELKTINENSYPRLYVMNQILHSL